MKNSFLLFLSCIILLGCKEKLPNGEKEIIEFLKDEDNGYSQTKVINGVVINLTYKPTKLMVLQEIGGDDKYSLSKKDSLFKKYKKNLYFVLSYSKDNKEVLSTISQSREQFNFVQNNLTFNMNHLTSLITKKDTIPLLEFNFPRTYGMSRSSNILFVFDKNKLNKKNNIVNFNVKDIGLEVGDITFELPTKLFDN